jgi:phosphoglycerate dehydrogenase-like enzyme
MASPNIFIFAPADETGVSHRKLEAAGCKLRFGQASWHTPKGDNEETMVGMARDAVALAGTSIRSSPISRRIISASPDLRIVAKYTIGVDDVDVEAATELGVLVCHGPTESNWGGVAEGAMAMMLAILKKTRERDLWVKDGGWRDAKLQGTYIGRRQNLHQDGYAGITIGLIGFGRVGRRFADLLAPWRARVIACDPYVDQSVFVHHNVERVDQETLLRTSDVVSLHVVLNKETRHMIGEREFALMKPTAVFLNTARGQAVDEDALFHALDRDKIAGAAIDVFEDEPVAKQSPLLGLGHKILVSPHMVSGNHGSGLGPGIVWGTEAVLKALRGDLPDNVFNKEVIPRWRQRFGGKSVLPKSI